MNLSSVAVRRPVTFIMVFLIIIGFGLYSLSRLQLDLYPDMDFPTVMIVTSYTGASPEDIETLISRPIEGSVSSVKAVESVKSDSKQGVSVVTVEFDWGKDMEQAETEVRRKLELVTGMLPDDAADPMVFAMDPSMQPIVMMTVTGPYPQDELRKIADDDISTKLERLDGIATADAAGGLQREIHVTLDPVKMEAFSVDPSVIVGAIYQENIQEPGGSLEQGALDFTIQTNGKYQSVDEIGEVVIGVRQGADGPQPLRLREMATIEDSFVEAQRILETDGEPSIWMIVRKQSGANTVQAADAVMAALEDIENDTSINVDFKIIFNQADHINSSISNLSTTAILGVAISFMVLLFFLRNFPSAMVIATAIPLSVIATFSVMDQAGMTLNILSMAGLALSIGMLVDNAIVVLENIFRLRQEGLSIKEAAIKGAGEVSTAVIASTLTTVSVFVPVLFVPGIAGILFKDMAVTICFALAVSLAVALTFIPLASSKLLGRQTKTKDIFKGLRNQYGKGLDWTLKRRWVVVVFLAGLLGITGVLVSTLPMEFMAASDSSMVEVSLETQIGNNLNESYDVSKEVVSVVEESIPAADRKLVSLDMGLGEGFTSIFSKGVHAGTIRVPLVKVEQRETSQAEYEAKIRQAAKKIPGVKVTTGSHFNIAGGEGDMEIEIMGHDLDASRKIGLELEKQLESLPQMAEVNFSMEDQKPQVSINFDRPKMAELGLSTSAVGRSISTYFMGKIAGFYSDDGDEYNILVRYKKEHRLDIAALKQMPVTTANGETVSLSNIADVNVELGPVGISRVDQQRVTKLACTLKNQYLNKDGETVKKDLRSAITDVEKILTDYDWPQNFDYHVGGTAEDFTESFSYLGIALLISIFLVYMVMASQFESLRQPFIILLSVPLALVGVVLMFVLTGAAMDMAALVGVIMLVGIVVNNGIVMIDAANQFRIKGLDKFKAIAEASRLRLRPVLLTSMTTILSMVPLALELGEGAEAWSGMARAVIGGLTVATILTLFVVPTMYTVFARKEIES